MPTTKGTQTQPANFQTFMLLEMLSTRWLFKNPPNSQRACQRGRFMLVLRYLHVTSVLKNFREKEVIRITQGKHKV